MAIYSYEIGEVFTATGTATSSAASKTVEGTGTDFVTEFAAGYLIVIAGETRVVASITDADTLLVTENFTAGSGGAVAFEGVNMVNVEDLTTPLPAPKGLFKDYAQQISLGDGSVRGGGWAVGGWRFGFLTRAQRDQLRTFCTGASNSIYIRSRENDTADAYRYYTCKIVWPQEEEKDHGFRLEFVPEFRDMVEVAIS